MRLRDRDQPLDPRAERELDAVDRELAGREVDPDLGDLAELTRLLSEERPEPAPGWTEELDRRAAAGFREDGHAGGWSNLAARLGGARPMRLLGPAGALATAAVVVVVGVSSLGGGTDDSGTVESADAPATAINTSEGVSTDSGSAAQESSGDALSAADGRRAAPPTFDADAVAENAYPATEPALRAFDRDADRLARSRSKRQVERDVTLALSTRPEEVRDATDEALAITRSLGGVVASSQVTESGRQATATLELTLPTRELDTAIDRLTELGNVDSLNETMEDITRPFVSAQDELEDAEAQRTELLEALGNAETAVEAEALRLQIEDVRREISRAESQFDEIARRARLSDVSLTIQSDPNAEARDDERSLGDWLDDTVSVLRDVAGVLLVTAAIVVPVGILVALIWFAVSAMRRYRRERALDA